MNVLALDSSSSILSVALKTGSGAAEASLDLGRTHAESLITLVDFCMKRANCEPKDLDLIACAAGPGSFTGLRIGMATAKGIALALGKPWVAVPTLDCLAWGRECFSGAVAPILDGKRGRVYTAIYSRGSRTTDWLDIPLARLASLLDTYAEALVTGPDADLFEEFAVERSGFFVDRRARDPAARALAELAVEIYEREGAADNGTGPLYLRPSEAEESAPAREGKGPD